jgi:hypothetical protein
VGKFNLAKLVLSTGGFLEMSWRSEGEEKKALGIPQGLEKQGGESILVLKPLASPALEQPLLRVPLGKISLLKRIKQSIFGE